MIAYPIAPIPVEPRPSFVFTGDSVTEFWARDRTFFADRGYLARGIGGETSGQIAARFRSDVLDLRPVRVHILAGTNDIAENGGPIALADIARNVIGMAQAAAAAGIGVAIGAVPPTDDYPWRPGLAPRHAITRLNAMLERHAAEAGHVFIDYHGAMRLRDGSPDPSLLPDGVHPSPLGYARMEAVFDRAMRGPGWSRLTRLAQRAILCRPARRSRSP